jgi:hypothetical protein
MRVGVAALAPHKNKKWMRDFLVAQKGQDEHAVAATGAFLLLLPTEQREWITNHQWHLCPISTLHKELGTYLEQVRMCGRADNSPLGEELATSLAKFKNLLGRDLGDADWNQERLRGWPAYSWRTLSGSRTKYKHALFHALLMLARRTVQQLAPHHYFSTLEQFWSKRAKTLPNGSSSLRHLIDGYKKLDPRIKSNNRPGKKGVWEAISREDMAQMVDGTHLDSCRASTNQNQG